MIRGIAGTDLRLDSTLLGVVAARVLHILLKSSDAHGLADRRLGVLVPTYLGPKTFKMSRGLLVKVGCILVVAENWLSAKSRRVRRVEAEIPVGQGVSLRVDLLKVVRAAVRIERVSLVSFQLVVEVSRCNTRLAVVLLGSQSRVWIRPGVQRPVVMVTVRAHGELWHLDTRVRHVLVGLERRGAVSLSSERVGPNTLLALSMNNVSVKTLI